MCRHRIANQACKNAGHDSLYPRRSCVDARIHCVCFKGRVVGFPNGDERYCDSPRSD